MKRPSHHAWRRRLLLIIVPLVISGILFLILMAIQSTSATSLSSLQIDTPYPTNYPAGKQTLEARLRLTQEAAALTPFPTGTVWSFPLSTSTPGPWELTPFPATPAGDGEIIDMADAWDLSKLLNINLINKWYAEVGDRHLNVFAGSDYNDPPQGMVYITIFTADGSQLPDGGYYPTATRSGAVQIVGAQGQRLILLSTGGETFYFDVPGQQFTASLTESVPTVTPWPITPRPTNTPAFTDDAPNTPNDITGLSSVNTTHTFTINPGGDEDWFRFHLAIPGTIQIQLTNLPANYDLYVYSVSFPYSGQSTQTGNTDEIVTIPDAPADDYLVRVVAVNGAFDPNNPYQLRIGAACDPVFTIAEGDTTALINAVTTANGTPEPDTICLAENGTYTFTAAYSSSNALPDITSEITIEGQGATLTRDAAAPNFRLIQVDSAGTLTLNDLTLTNGNDDNSGGGGAIDNNGGTLTVNRGTFSGNTGSEGGAIDNDTGASLTITDTAFSGNTVTGSGGAINNDGGITISGSTFTNNTAGDDGGAIDNDAGTTVTITDTTFSSNSATASGGALNNDGDITISGSTFTGNMAGVDGGAIDHDSGTIDITDSQLNGNTALDDGGAIDSYIGSNLALSNTVLSGNNAQSDGGAIYSRGTLTIIDSELSSNTADDDAGAIEIGSEGNLTMTNTLVSGNSADDQGGAIYNRATVTIIGSEFSNNVAGDTGGAIYALSSATSSADQSCFTGNSATAVRGSGSTVQDFTDNWWGDASGPSGSGPGTGDSVSSNINFTPWLTSNVCQP